MFLTMPTLLQNLFRRKLHLLAFVLFWGLGYTSVGSETVFTVLATADLHGKETALLQAVAPAVKKEYRKAPGKVIYVDIGDTAQGSLSLLKSRGSGFVSRLNQLDCAFFVPGNHELEYGFEAFKNIISEFSGKVLAANLHAPEIADRFFNWAIVEKDNVKIAFIGLMLNNMEYCFPVDEKRFRTLPGRSVLRKAVNQVRKEGAEIIILLRHAGKYGSGENTYDLIKDVPEIDLVIGAHTHRGDAGSMVGRSWYVQPPAHGKALAKINIIFDRDLRRIKQITSSFVNLPQVKEFDPAADEKAPCWVGKSMDHPAEIIRKKYSADLAVYAVNNPGKLRKLLTDPAPVMGDFYEVFAYHDPVVTVKVSSGEFQTIFREYVRFAHKRKQYLAKSGFAAQISRSRVRRIGLPPGKDFYTLAISAYAAAGAGGNLPDTRRILKEKTDHSQAEKSASLLEVLTTEQ